MNERLKFKLGKQHQLLLEWKNKREISQQEMAELLEVKRRTVRQWIEESRTLPEEIFDKICKMDSEFNKFKNHVLKKLHSNWGQSKGGKITSSKDTIKTTMKNLRDKMNEKRRMKKNKIKIKNKLVEELIFQGVDLKRILAVCLLTDGSLVHKRGSFRIEFYTKNIVLKKTVYAILFKLSEFLPSISISKDGTNAIRVSDKNLASTLLELSPNFKTSPRNQTLEEYLKETQPTLKFLNDINETTRLWSMRFAFSTDGCVSLSKRGIAHLSLSCSHPKLCNEWKEFFNKMGLYGKIWKRKDSWSGFGGILFTNVNSIRTFWKMGGFVPGVKISGHSRYYKGLEKNKLLKEIIMKMGPKTDWARK